VITEGAFVPHTPDPTLSGTTIVYGVRLDYFGKMSKKDQRRLIDANPQANKKAPVFYVGQTSLEAWQRYENHLNSYKAGRGWVKKYGQHLIRLDEWRPDFGVALPEQTIKAARQLARRSKADPLKREQSIAELLRVHGYGDSAGVRSVQRGSGGVNHFAKGASVYGRHWWPVPDDRHLMADNRANTTAPNVMARSGWAACRSQAWPG